MGVTMSSARRILTWQDYLLRMMDCRVKPGNERMDKSRW
jgi:hypothetical protein